MIRSSFCGPCGEHLKRQPNEADIEDVREAICDHLTERGEPASYLHVHAAGLVALIKSHALKQNNQEFDEALRSTQSLIQTALKEDPRFVHYSNGEKCGYGVVGIQNNVIRRSIGLCSEELQRLAQYSRESPEFRSLRSLRMT